jgi:hypothetical protein
VAQERIVAIRLSLVQFSQLNCKAGQVRTVSYGKQPQLNPKFELRAAGYLSRSLVTGGAPLMQMAKNPVKFREGSPGADFVLPKQICL